MRITVVGTGYVGLVTGVCMAEKGHDVTCLDIDKKKIETLKNGKNPIYESNLEELMTSNSSHLTYTIDYCIAYRTAEVIFISVGTPEKADGSVNLSCVYAVSRQIAETVVRDCVVVVKSTVPIGTNDRIEKLLNDNKKNNVQIDVVSNPEFLSQGTAVRDTLHANRIVVGTESSRAENIMRELYKDYDAPVLVMDRKSAEMVKYASNDFLALKISYINEIANLCEIVGANVEDVALGMGYDDRIGDKFLKAGIGYGGSCFPKDTKALHWFSCMNGYEIKTVKAAIEVNEQQKLKLIKKARKYYDSFGGLTVAVLGLTFKPGTDDVRESPSLVNIPIFLEEGANVKAWDPVGIENFKNYFPEGHRMNGLMSYSNSPTEALASADICFIFTEWDEIKALAPDDFKNTMNTPLVFDGRNIYIRDKMKTSGIEYYSVGR